MDEKCYPLYYGLDYYIPTSVNKNHIHGEFQAVFLKLSTDLADVPETELWHIKARLRKTSEHYCNVKIHTVFELSLRDCLKEHKWNYWKQRKEVE